MNIFFVDKNPRVSAQSLADKHVVKMIVETAQMMSTAHHLHPVVGIPLDKIYKKTHQNHPCAVWVRQNDYNYAWTANHLLALLDEYTARYGKTHQTANLVQYLYQMPELPFGDSITLPPSCMEDEFKVVAVPTLLDDVVLNYRNFYRIGKKHLHQWKRNRPDWL